MKLLYVSIGLVLLQVAAMIGGAFTGSTLFISVGFCSMPVVWAVFGWSLHASGVRVSFGDLPTNGTQPRRPAPVSSNGTGVTARKSRLRSE